ncbi:unnamed protein product [Phytophthora fragariaefolia]|uniref:Unnamed protein product n=1 Tax=Phytophthora fragariaefolia TaxID=1490495 RepID=A0A9W6XK26_9STRA|nr:unnamed protein product [Phytophthora fragariaefolia]
MHCSQSMAAFAVVVLAESSRRCSKCGASIPKLSVSLPRHLNEISPSYVLCYQTRVPNLILLTDWYSRQHARHSLRSASVSALSANLKHCSSAGNSIWRLVRGVRVREKPKDVLNEDVPHDLHGDFGNDEPYHDHLQLRIMLVRELLAKDIQSALFKRPTIDIRHSTVQVMQILNGTPRTTPEGYPTAC